MAKAGQQQTRPKSTSGRSSWSEIFQIARDPSLDDLRESFKFDVDKAEIWLNGRRMVLSDNLGLGIMRRELMAALGYEGARGLMSRIGYGIGAADAELALHLRKDEDLFVGFTVGPQLHALKGSVKVEPLVFEADRKSGNFYSEYLWHNSAECHAHVAEMGIGAHPGGWQQVGYASGYASAFFGRPMIFRELQCIAMGHERCFLVGKPAELWDNAQAELRWFRAEQYSTRPEHDPGRKQAVAEDLEIGQRSIVGASSGFNIVLHLVDKVARTDAPVLLLGESGVGKEVFARELHKRSRRADKPVVAVNCAAIPDALMESELFGVEKGAFTGANASRPGRFERAAGGTLFLDEIGTLSLAAQGKLLRVLQEGEFERVGGVKPLKADVRLIAATNADLRTDMEKGTFRADLFHRLNTFPIRIPPLRERRADIPLLANHFLRILSAKHGKTGLEFDEGVIRYFHDYAWPGNIREMENTIERGIILAEDGELIGVHHLTMNTGAISTKQSRESGHDPFWNFIMSQVRNGPDEDLGGKMLEAGLTMDGMTDLLVSAALDDSAGNITEAGRRIGMTRSQVSYWMKKRTGGGKTP
ncbi:MAG: sigma-54-dependent Fis family transcriptional regulator [Sphingomonas sp. SCN 67-18]|uniref:sigma-54-dependent Fis family transcriptional regulator n=1 Tax=uncultured Sphingomonas sp. TaxID=158754 RepID=UPI00086E1C74|nr:sigma-54-dependent Fis family transcriptional regulator [Sphingomonas sp. SCN 67-18]ODU21694.1 MAG: sigma-54-dependent Fis family transcriptional regulator [Sphingomonas sp. SCN 67-18]